MQGLIDLSYAPHVKQILADLSPQSPVNFVIFVCGTQLAKSTLNLIVFAYRVDCRLRGPMLAMHAIEKMALDWAKDELEETIVANKYISDVLQQVGKKHDPYLFKKWPGSSLIIRGGGSGTSYAKVSAAFLSMDDVDRFIMNVGGTTGKTAKIGEGNPLALLTDRVSGRFGDYKIFANSSPKPEGESIIWPAFKRTDQNHFFVFCPKCNHPQVWEFENVKFPHKDYILIEEPYIECQNTDCGHRIYERDKYKALQNAEYRPTAEGTDKLTRGYRVSSLYSLLGYPIEQYAKDWLSASKLFDETGDESEKIRHRNSKQAKPWKRKAGKTVKFTPLYNSRVSLDPLPENCIILSAGVDVQEEPARLEIQVNGHGINKTYFIDHQTFPGDPHINLGEEGSPWNTLQDFVLNKRYENINGIGQPIYSLGIDIRYARKAVKDFLLSAEFLYFQKSFGVFGKATTAAAISFITTPSKDVDGWETWGYYGDIGKSALYNLLRGHLLGRKGLDFALKACFSEKWFKQLTIEREDEKGHFKKPHEHSRNEATDCFLCSRASFILAFREALNGQPDWEDWKKWNRLPFEQQKTSNGGVIGSIF